MNTLAIISALLASLSWAAASVSMSRVLESGLVSPAAANLFKNSAAAFFFLLATLIFGGSWPVGQAWAWLFLSGFLGFAVSDTLYFAAFRRCGVQTAATVLLLNVPIATLLAVPLAGDTVSSQIVPFMVVVLAGVLLVILDSRSSSKRAEATVEGEPAAPQSYLVGVLLAILAAFAIGAAVPIGRGRFGDIGVYPGGFIRLVGGAIGAVPVALVAGLFARSSSASRETSRLLEPIFAAPGPGSVWARASIVGVGCAVAGLFPYHYALRELPGGISATLFSSTPLFTIPLALIMAQHVGWKGILGTIVGFFGVAGILLEGRLPAPGPPPVTIPVPEVLSSPVETVPGLDAGRRPTFVVSRKSVYGDSESNEADSNSLLLIAQPIVQAEEAAPRAAVLYAEDARPRELFQEVTPVEVARGHWADLPAAARLSSGGLLLAIPAGLGESLVDYGVRLALEFDGPPAVDIGWLHEDLNEVLHGFVEALPLADGAAQLVWVDDRPTEEAKTDLDGVVTPAVHARGMAIMSRRVGADGTLGDEEMVEPAACDCCPPTLLELDDGSLVVAYRRLAEGDIRDIYVSRRGTAAGTWEPPVSVFADGWQIEGCPVTGPAMAYSPGTLAVAWMTRAPELDAGRTPGDEPSDKPVGAPPARIQIAFSTDGGRVFGTPIELARGDSLGRVALAYAGRVSGEDRFLVAHLAVDDGQDAAEGDANWRLAVVASSGASSEFIRLAGVPASPQSGRLELARISDGRVRAAWTGQAGVESAEIRLPDVVSESAQQ